MNSSFKNIVEKWNAALKTFGVVFREATSEEKPSELKAGVELVVLESHGWATPLEISFGIIETLELAEHGVGEILLMLVQQHMEHVLRAGPNASENYQGLWPSLKKEEDEEE